MNRQFWKEFAIKHNISLSTVENQLRKGKCKWPRMKQKQGAKSSSAYSSWAAMWQRCTNSNQDNYAYYGGRGISVDARWKSFLVFLKDVGPRPGTDHSLDRIDPNGNYEPGNVRWALATLQARNTRGHLNKPEWYGISKHGRKFQINRNGTVHRFTTLEEALDFKRGS